LLLIAAGALFYGLVALREHDYVAAIIAVTAGLLLSRSAVDALRLSVGE
jgi:hypothetical protein